MANRAPAREAGFITKPPGGCKRSVRGEPGSGGPEDGGFLRPARRWAALPQAGAPDRDSAGSRAGCPLKAGTMDDSSFERLAGQTLETLFETLDEIGRAHV